MNARSLTNIGNSHRQQLPTVDLKTCLMPFKEAELLDANGHINLLTTDFFKRLEIMQELLENASFNAVMLEHNLLVELPAGAGMRPMPVFPKVSDGWTKADGGDLPVGPGLIMPSALFYEKLAIAAGARVTITSESVVELIPGQPHYKVVCSASLLLPSGEVLEVQGEGKSQPLLTKYGTIQAHIEESTRRKAKRNAIKVLFGLPTIMAEADFMRPWIVFRPVFDAATAGDKVRAIIARRDKESNEAVAQLYGPDTAAPVAAGDATLTNLRQRLNAATTTADVNAIGRELARIPMGEEQRAEVRREYHERLQRIKTGEVVGTQVPIEATPAAQQTVEVTTPGE